jgi:hypothetical protein
MYSHDKVWVHVVKTLWHAGQCYRTLPPGRHCNIRWVRLLQNLPRHAWAPASGDHCALTIGKKTEGTRLHPDTAAKMTWFWARFKQHDLQNRAIREILAKSYRIGPQNCAELVPKTRIKNSPIGGFFYTDSFMQYDYEYSLLHRHICWALKY